MSPQASMLLETLSEAGLLEAAPAMENGEGTPWYVKLLLAFAGWLSSLALLGFIALILHEVLNSDAMGLVCGAALTGGAAVILHENRNTFTEHLALSFSFAGQVLFAVALFGFWDNNEAGARVCFAMLQGFLALAMPSFTHRVISAFLAVGVLYLSLASSGAHGLVPGAAAFLAAWCWLNEFTYPKRMGRIRSVGYGVLLALIFIELYGLRGDLFDWLPLDVSWHAGWLPTWLAEAVGGAVLVYAVWRLLRRYEVPVSTTAAIQALVAAILLGVLSIKVQGLTLGMLIILLGFAGSNRILVGLGASTLLLYVGFYYYNLDTTLLVKAGTLFAIGLTMLVLRWLMTPRRRKQTDGEEVQYG